MELGMSLCRTIKRQKSMSFLGPKIWKKISSNIKTAGTTSFMHHLKKEILSKLQEWVILLIFYHYYYCYYYYYFFIQFFESWFLGGAPTTICHFFCPSVCLSVVQKGQKIFKWQKILSITLNISRTIHHMIVIYGKLV